MSIHRFIFDRPISADNTLYFFFLSVILGNFSSLFSRFFLYFWINKIIMKLQKIMKMYTSFENNVENLLL